jgi:mannose-6-phosphate isomerase-like protein (cupin superfamily)
MNLPTRRIVTGVDAEGASVVVSDGPTPNTFGPAKSPYLINFWAIGSTPADYADPQDPAASPIPLHPAPGGVTFRFFRVPPESAFAHLTDEQRRAGAKAYHAQVGAPDAYVPDARHPGFHKTQSVDFIVLLEGEVTLLLDKDEVPMKPFDVVVQRGTSHSWANYGDTTALLMAVLVDAKPGE